MRLLCLCRGALPDLHAGDESELLRNLLTAPVTPQMKSTYVVLDAVVGLQDRGKQRKLGLPPENPPFETDK